MEDLFEKFNRSADVRMTDDERSAMRSRLQALSEATPILRAAPVARSAAPGTKRPFFGVAKAVPAFSLMVAVLFAAGGAYAAEGALPGDALYPVKTRVIENVRSAITVSAEAKAKWESERATRRLEEIEHLAAVGKLDEEKAEALAARFESHSSRVGAQLEEMRKKGDDPVAAAAQHGSSLRAHERVLVRLEEARPGMFAGLAATVRAEADETEGRIDGGGDRESDDDDVDDARSGEGRNDVTDEETVPKVPSRTEAAAMGVRAAAEHKIGRLEKLAQRWRDRMGDERLADVTEALEEANAAFLEGEARLEAGDHGAAFIAFRLAHGHAQEAKGFGIIDLRLRSDVDGHETGDARVNKVDVRGWDPEREEEIVGESETESDDGRREDSAVDGNDDGEAEQDRRIRQHEDADVSVEAEVGVRLDDDDRDLRDGDGRAVDGSFLFRFRR